MFFDSWNSLLRVLIVGVLAYISLVLFLRVSGKRTLSKMNAFDFVVTVAPGSTLATVFLSKQVSLSEGVFALALLIGLQYVIAWFSVRSSLVRRIVKSEPRLLVFRGELLRGHMKQERVTEGEILATLRAHGFSAIESVYAVVLETDGNFTVLSGSADGQASSTLDSVSNFPPRN